MTKSDLSIEDLKLARSHDSEVPWILLSHGTGLSMNTRMPEDFQQLSCCLRFLDWCFDRSGSKLGKIKEDGIFEQNGTFNWVDVVLRMQFDESTGKLAALTHVPSGLAATLPAGFPVSKDYEFHCFWSAQDAYAILKPMKKINLQPFWGMEAKPFNHLSGGNYKKAREELEKQAFEITKEWKQAIEKAKGENSAGTEEREQIAQKLKEQTAQKRRAKVPEMNKKAKELLETKMAKRKLNFDAKQGEQ